MDFVCTADDMHPYACDGPGKCIHCDRRQVKGHVPSLCVLCRETPLVERKPGPSLKIAGGN